MIAIFVFSIIGTYIGLQIALSTSTPLVAVAGGSMRPTLEFGDLVVVQGVPATNIQVGDIIVFDPPEGGRTVHRVTKMETLPNGTIQFITKGDDNEDVDTWPVPDYCVHGRVLYRIPYLGYLALDPAIPITITIIAIIVILLWPEKTRRKFRRHRR